MEGKGRGFDAVRSCGEGLQGRSGIWAAHEDGKERVMYRPGKEWSREGNGTGIGPDGAQACHVESMARRAGREAEASTHSERGQTGTTKALPPRSGQAHSRYLSHDGLSLYTFYSNHLQVRVLPRDRATGEE